MRRAPASGLRHGIDALPAQVVAEISRSLQSEQPSADALVAAQRQLVGFDAAAASETVIESYYGCIITEHLLRTYEIAASDLPFIVNSSHRAVRRVCLAPDEHLHSGVSRDEWEAGWETISDQHEGVDMQVRTAHRDRSLRHADLYVVAAGQIVSLEYKYVGDKGVTCPNECARQMRPYLEAHAATLMVVYCGIPSNVPVRGMRRLRELLAPAIPLELHGPAIVPVRARLDGVV